MAITSRKITTYAKNIVDLSDQPNKDGLTAAQLKAMFDGRTDEEVKASINGIVDDLVATTDGASGADQVGATPVGGGTGNTVQEVLEEIDTNAVHKTGNETVAGVKTFSSSPIVPTPTTDMQASTKKYVDELASEKVDTADIVNDLTTGGTTAPLSAEQGKTLKGEFGALASLSTTEKGSLVGAINEVDGHADTNATNIGTLASLTTTEKTNLVGAINELNADKIETTAIANTLTETDAGKVLDARQGKTLFDKIGTQTYTEDNYITDSEPLTESVDKLDMAVKDNADLISNIIAEQLQSTHIVYTTPAAINSFENGVFVERVKRYVLQSSDITAVNTYTHVQQLTIPLSKFAGVAAQSTSLADGSFTIPNFSKELSSWAQE